MVRRMADSVRRPHYDRRSESGKVISLHSSEARGALLFGITRLERHIQGREELQLIKRDTWGSLYGEFKIPKVVIIANSYYVLPLTLGEEEATSRPAVTVFVPSMTESA